MSNLQPDARRVDQTTWYFAIDPVVPVVEPGGTSHRHLNEVQVVRTFYSDSLTETWRASCRGQAVTSTGAKRGGQAPSYSAEAHAFEAEALAIVKEGR